MVEKVNPSFDRPAEAFKTAGSIAYGGSTDGFIIDASSPTEISSQDTGVDETTFTAFDVTHSPTSFDVTIGEGEAFVFGSWLAIDTTTTVSLAPSTAGQTVYVGWNKNAANDVIIGLNSAFASASGDTDQKIPLYSIDTDGSGVTTVQDLREIGEFSESDGFIGSDTLDSGKRLNIESDEYMVVGGSYTLNGDASIDGDLVTVANAEPHSNLSEITPTDHLSVEKEYQVTLDSGSNPAFDGTLTNAFDEQLRAFDVTVAPTSGLNDTYAFNFDDGKAWNNGSWDVPLTVNWDDDPGSDLDLTVRIHKRT